MVKTLFGKSFILFIAALICFFAFFGSAHMIIINIVFVGFLFFMGIMVLKLEEFGILGVLTSIGPIVLKITLSLPKRTLITRIIEMINEKQQIVYSNIDYETCYSLLFYILFAAFLLLIKGIYALIKKIKPMVASRSCRKHNAVNSVDFTEETKRFCDSIRQTIASLDDNEYWNSENNNGFIPLEARMETTVGGKQKSKTVDLLTCIKNNKTFFSFGKFWALVRCKPNKTVFLVLGVPGAGKSKALRKLCLELLDEVATTKKVPLYVDLKKWDEPWTISNPPSKNDLYEFIQKRIREDYLYLGIDDFINDHYKRMINEGQFYFIFDSFDEMPCLMGKEKGHELVDMISGLLHDILIEGKQTGGVIASRTSHPYRDPSKKLKPDVVLEIREFDNSRIKKMFHQKIKQYSDPMV